MVKIFHIDQRQLFAGMTLKARVRIFFFRLPRRMCTNREKKAQNNGMKHRQSAHILPRQR